MALSGTLKDFGIADILQLIGNQTKTGRLTLTTSKDEIEVFFVDGNVVFASEVARDSRNLLGNLLLRAELLSPQQLEEALAEQQRTLKRLGDIVTDRGIITKPQLAQMMRLQTTETLYRLFSWKNGSYEFHQEEVEEWRSAFDPIRAESILLEGFRRTDEWPRLKKSIPASGSTFERLQPLDTSGAASIDETAGEGEEGEPGPRHKLIYRLANAGKDLQGVIDASRLGEFEAIKALTELLAWGYLRAVAPPSGARALASGLRSTGDKLARTGAIVRLSVSLASFLAAIALAKTAAPRLGSARLDNPARQGAVARVLAHGQALRLESALELYRVEHGEYPEALSALVENAVVTPSDLEYPYPEPYYYRRTAQGFVLLPPLD